METQLNARPTLAVRARTVSGCLNSAFSRHFYTFYGSSVQAMDTQLNGLPTLPVLARTVSGYLNSAFLGLERNRSVVGKTKAPLVAGGPQQLTPPTPQRRLSPGLESMACWSVGRE